WGASSFFGALLSRERGGTVRKSFTGEDCVQPGSRAAVLRRREPTRFSSASDDEVGGFQRDPQRAERAIKQRLRRTPTPPLLSGRHLAMLRRAPVRPPASSCGRERIGALI